MKLQSASTATAEDPRPEVARPLWEARRLRRDPIGFLQDLASQGDVVPFRVGPLQAFLLSNPADIERVLITDRDRFAKGSIYERSKRLLGNGLFTASGDFHKHRRAVISPAFHRGALNRYAEIMLRLTQRMSDGWRDGDVIDLPEQMQRLTVGIVSQTLFGTSLSAHKAAEIREALASAIDSIDSLLSIVAPKRKMEAARERLDAVVQDLIDHRLQSNEAADDLLSILLQMQATTEPDAIQLRDDVLTFLVAGHDTVGNALTWTWLLTALNPDVEARLTTELRNVLGDRLPESADLSRLPYTRATFAEGLRLMPPAWAFARVARTNYQLGSTEIPEGSVVVMSQMLVHRDARFFPRPLTFDPDRWLSTPAVPRSKCTYFPFGAGPRSCIGEGFAWMEGVLVLATLAQRWQLSAVHPGLLKVTPQLTLRPLRPLHVGLRRRS